MAYEKGRSGNPSGRPPTTLAARLARKGLSMTVEQLVELIRQRIPADLERLDQLIARAEQKGDDSLLLRAIELRLGYALGRPGPLALNIPGASQVRVTVLTGIPGREPPTLQIPASAMAVLPPEG